MKNFLPLRSLGILICFTILLSSCNMMKKASRVEAKRLFTPERTYKTDGIKVPNGYKIELVTKELTYPTAVTFDEQGNVYVIEAGYAYKPKTTKARLLKIKADGSRETIFEAETGPWTGLTFYEGNFYVAEGAFEGKSGKVRKISKEGNSIIIYEGLPTLGDHYTGELEVGPDGYLYFGNGTATNSAVVGKDNWKMGWMSDGGNRDFHDTPCRDIILRGKNYTTDNPLTAGADDKATTGAYVPFGEATIDGQIIRGEVPCSGALYKMRPDGSDFQLIAWGFRNPYGLAFSPDGQLYTTENGFDARGSRPVENSLDHLWKVEQNTWYGFPDYSGGVLLSDKSFVRLGEENAALLLKEYPQQPPKPVALFGIHSSSNGFDFSRSAAFGHKGKAFVAQFGDMSPITGSTSSPVGFKVVSVDVETGEVLDFVQNKKIGPASSADGGGLERPVSVSFSPDGNALYIVDFGNMVISPLGPDPETNSGAIWKITKQ